DHPRAGVHFDHMKIHGRPFGGGRELDARSHVGAHRDADFLTPPTQDHRRQTLIYAEAAGTDAAKGKTTAMHEAHAPDIALAQCGVPVRLDLTRFFVDSDAVIDTVVDDNEGAGAKTKRAVPVPEYGGLVGQAACGIVVAPPALHRWVIH